MNFIQQASSIWLFHECMQVHIFRVQLHLLKVQLPYQTFPNLQMKFLNDSGYQECNSKMAYFQRIYINQQCFS